jgi:hypothetical protein
MTQHSDKDFTVRGHAIDLSPIANAPSPTPRRKDPPMAKKYEPDPLAVRADDTYESYRDRMRALGSLGEPDVHPNAPGATGQNIDKRARELLAAEGVTRIDYRSYRDACARAAAELAGGQR